jgi:hypothetical protein
MKNKKLNSLKLGHLKKKFQRVEEKKKDMLLYFLTLFFVAWNQIILKRIKLREYN